MGKTVLVVDDDVEMTLIMKDVLTEYHYHVEVAHNGLEAIKKSKQEAVDLILLDIRMPFFSGLWFCEAFKRRPETKNIPVVIVSALSSDDAVQQAYKRGAVDYLKKPFITEDLVRVVEKNIS